MKTPNKKIVKLQINFFFNFKLIESPKQEDGVWLHSIHLTLVKVVPPPSSDNPLALQTMLSECQDLQVKIAKNLSE